MFGPTTKSKINELIDYNHREPHFFSLYQDTITLIKEKFGLHDYDIIIISGSGSLTIESLIFSSKYKIHPTGPRGSFYDRWKSLSNFYNSGKKDDEIINLYCAYETSISKSFVLQNAIVDAVCSFPYYPISKESIAFGTVSNKMLGAAPLIGIVGIKKDKWNLFIDNSIPSYLNLKRYKEFADKMQTPFTPAFSLVADLKNKLENFDKKKIIEKINEVSEMLVDAIGIENIIGEVKGPAITLKKNIIPDEISKKWNLYGYWHNNKQVQLFTYSEDIEDYKKLIWDLKKF